MASPPADGTHRETVVIVHGTFSGHDPGKGPGWYAPGQPFCRELDEALASSGSAARCWQHLAPGEAHFHWDGANDWLSRLRAAQRLRHEVRQWCKQGWTVHVVAHSHGGNIAVDALCDDAGRVQPWFKGQVVLLGTPLLRESPAFWARRRSLAARWAAASVVGWALVLLAASRGLDLRAPFSRGAEHEQWASVLFVVLVLALLVLCVRIAARLLTQWPVSIGWKLRLQPALRQQAGRLRRSPVFMMINSRFDEAYRALVAVQAGPNPLMDPPPARGSLWNRLRAVADTGWRRLSDLIGRTLDTPHAAALVLVGSSAVALMLAWRALSPVQAGALDGDDAAWVFWILTTVIVIAACCFDRFVFLPGIVLLEGLGVLARAVSGLAALQFARQVRSAVWGFTQSLLLGLSGAARRVQDVRVQMRFDPNGPEDCIQLELPTPIVEGVVAAQTARLGEIRDLLYREGGSWSAVTLRSELEAIDFPLVHTCYYRQPACIRKVADWLCEPPTEALDGSRLLEVNTLGPTGADGRRVGVQEQVRSVNAYRQHLDDLQQRHAGADGAWAVAPDRLVTTPMAPAGTAPRRPLPQRPGTSGPPPRGRG